VVCFYTAGEGEVAEVVGEVALCTGTQVDVHGVGFKGGAVEPFCSVE
jgi:hypothetical protein